MAIETEITIQNIKTNINISFKHEAAKAINEITTVQ